MRGRLQCYMWMDGIGMDIIGHLYLHLQVFYIFDANNCNNIANQKNLKIQCPITLTIHNKCLRREIGTLFLVKHGRSMSNFFFETLSSYLMLPQSNEFWLNFYPPHLTLPHFEIRKFNTERKYQDIPSTCWVLNMCFTFALSINIP